MAFSFNLAKEHMCLSQAVAATEERLRLARELKLKSVDISTVEAKSIIYAMQAATNRSLALSRQAIANKNSLGRDISRSSITGEDSTSANPSMGTNSLLAHAPIAADRLSTVNIHQRLEFNCYD